MHIWNAHAHVPASGIRSEVWKVDVEITCISCFHIPVVTISTVFGVWLVYCVF